MFKRSHSPFPRGVSAPHRRPPRRRVAPLRRPATVAACLAALAGCGDSLVPDPPSSSAAPTAPSFISGTAMSSDAVKLPPVSEVAAGLPDPGCVLHYRTLSDLYAEHRLDIEFSPSAREGAAGRLRLIAHGVNVTVERPLADGGTETLPERLGVRAVCRVPDTALGESEARAWIDVLLREKGLDTSAAASEAAARSARRVPPGPGVAPDGTITICVGWGGTGEVGVTCVRITITCPTGFDYEASSGRCRGSGGRTSAPGTGNTGRGGGGNNNNNQTTLRTVEFALGCTSPTGGSDGSCSVSTQDSAVTLGDLSYAWTSDAAAVPDGTSSWGPGTATTNRSVEVSISGSGIAGATKTATATVTPRVWTWPAGEDLGERNGSIPDHCYGDALGLTVGRMGEGSCSGHYFDYLNGFAVEAGSGPWGGTWYVASTSDSSGAGAFWGTSPNLRSDGPAHDTGTLPSDIRSERGCRASATVYQVNACSAALSRTHRNNRSAAFDGLVKEVGKHEGEHVAAVVAEAAKHNVWGGWEAVVGASESAARTGAQTAGLPAHAALLSATQGVDASYSAKTFRIWWWTGSQWEVGLVETGHRR